MARKTERSTRAEIGAKQRAYLRDTLRELGITATKLARLLDLSPSTFTRFVNLPDSSEKTLHPATIDKVEALRQVNSDSPIPTRAQGAWAEARAEAERLIITTDYDAVLADALNSIIRGQEGLEPWRLNTRALELEGYMPGDIVIVNLHGVPKAGDAVFATVREQAKAEPVMRQYQPAGPVDLLVPRTNDPTPPKTLVVDRNQVVIRGVLLPHRLKERAAA
jgi:hypothetical protein